MVNYNQKKKKKPASAFSDMNTVDWTTNASAVAVCANPHGRRTVTQPAFGRGAM